MVQFSTWVVALFTRTPMIHQEDMQVRWVGLIELYRLDEEIDRSLIGA